MVNIHATLRAIARALAEAEIEAEVQRGRRRPNVRRIAAYKAMRSVGKLPRWLPDAITTRDLALYARQERVDMVDLAALIEELAS